MGRAHLWKLVANIVLVVANAVANAMQLLIMLFR